MAASTEVEVMAEAEAKVEVPLLLLRQVMRAERAAPAVAGAVLQERAATLAGRDFTDAATHREDRLANIIILAGSRIIILASVAMEWSGAKISPPAPPPICLETLAQ
jgi:hypothetical protein